MSTTKNVSFLRSREYFGLVAGVHNYRHGFLSQILSHKGQIHSQCAVLLCDVFPDGKKLSKLRNFDRQERRPQNCSFCLFINFQIVCIIFSISF
jgi:hypothetical protein